MSNHLEELRENKLETTKEHCGGCGSCARFPSKGTGLGNAGRELPKKLFCSSGSVLCSILCLPILISCHPKQRSPLVKTKTFVCNLGPHTLLRTVGPAVILSHYQFLPGSRIPPRERKCAQIALQINRQSLLSLSCTHPTHLLVSHHFPMFPNQASSLSSYTALIFMEALTILTWFLSSSPSRIAVAQVSNDLHLTKSTEHLSVLVLSKLPRRVNSIDDSLLQIFSVLGFQ